MEVDTGRVSGGGLHQLGASREKREMGRRAFRAIRSLDCRTTKTTTRGTAKACTSRLQMVLGDAPCQMSPVASWIRPPQSRAYLVESNRTPLP